MKERQLLLLLLLPTVLLPVFGCARFLARTRPTLLKNASGSVTAAFQMHDSVLLEARRLSPRTGYEIQVVSDDGRVVVDNRLSTDQAGNLPETVVWYAIGAGPCWETPIPTAAEGGPAQVADAISAGRNYTLKISRGGQVVRTASFSVSESMLRPALYAADSRGCPKTGFLIGEEDIWVVGRNLPRNSLVRLWAVRAAADWKDGDALVDQTKQYGDGLPPLFELTAHESGFTRLVWPKQLTSIGSYDIAAEVVTYPFGAYREASSAPTRTLLSGRTHSGFVIQRRAGTAEPREMEIAGSVQSPFTFRSTFLTTENVYVGVDPTIQPAYVGKTADVYIVKDKTDAQWTNDKKLVDVTNYIEKITVNGVCGNCWKTLAWSAPLTVDKYDVVLDFNQDGLYTPGIDLIDSLDPVGFTVSEVRVDSISFNYGGSAAITIHDHLKAADITAPEYLSAGNVVKPAAWVMGGSHSVQVSFRAAASLSQAKIWATSGLGGLGSASSPVTVNFSGGKGQASFPVNSPPGSIAKTTFHWDWQYDAGSGSAAMGQTGEHILYTVLATPKAPQAKPWLGALEVACKLAQGKTTAEEATRAIWNDFYNSAGGLYDTEGGSPRYTGGWGDPFNLTKWLANYGSANIGVVNCYDMGKAVVVFANALGGSSEYTRTDPFGYLNLVKPIGRGWTNNPFYDYGPPYNANPIVNGDWSASDGRSYFGNHGFSRLAGQIFDGSGGQVDTDSYADTLPVGAAYALDGHDSWTGSYKNRVIDQKPAFTTGTPTVYTFTVY